MTYDPSKDTSKSSPTTPWQATRVSAVTPSDSADLASYPKALYIGVTGDVVVVPKHADNDTDTVTFKAHPVGYMPIQVRRVMSTNTTATNILALY